MKSRYLVILGVSEKGISKTGLGGVEVERGPRLRILVGERKKL